ncbi:MAG: polysaccharide biosynthesis tyrosine autokinase [Sporichthyaceae bacterium]
MTLKDYVTVLRERWLLVVLGLVLGLGGGAAVAFGTTPQYSASTTFFISTPMSQADASTQAAYQGTLLSTQRVKSYTSLATGESMRRSIGGVLGSPVADGVLTAAAKPDTVLLTISAEDPSPARALKIVELAATNFTKMVAEVERPATAKGTPLVTARQVEVPSLPAAPVSPRKGLNLALGFLLGLMAGGGAAIGRHALDRSVKSGAVASEIVGAPVLGVTTYDKSLRFAPLIVHDYPRAPLAEAFRQLRTNLQYVDLDQSRKLVVVTSSLPNEGKTSTTCNLAIAMAQVGRKVLLVEADLRRPKAGEYLGMENAVGLTDVLTGEIDLFDAIQPWGEEATMDFLGSGPLPPNPSEILASPQMQEVLVRLATHYDVVLFDAPPTLPVADAAVLATNCHAVLFIARHGEVRIEQMHAAVEHLNRVEAQVSGVVLTMAPRSKQKGGYGYGYGYGYGSYAPAPARSHHAAEPKEEVAVAAKSGRLRLPRSRKPEDVETSATTAS